MLYAVISSGTIQVRALPSRHVAKQVATLYPNGKVILDPRCVQR